MELGRRLQSRRREKQLSLRELARRAGLTASFLSQVEHDQVSPSIESLRKISLALDVPVYYLLIEDEDESPVVRSWQRPKLTLPDSANTLELLTPDLSQRMGAFLTERQPGEKRQAQPLRNHCEEFVYVLEGQMEIHLGDKTHFLCPGDAVYFSSPILRGIAAHGDATLRFISVIAPPAMDTHRSPR